VVVNYGGLKKKRKKKNWSWGGTEHPEIRKPRLWSCHVVSLQVTRTGVVTASFQRLYSPENSELFLLNQDSSTITGTWSSSSDTIKWPQNSSFLIKLMKKYNTIQFCY
jgi:hypothetical protein